MILGGEYRPGDRLIQQELAAKLESSVSVIRELLFEMASVGLVETVDSTGFFVGNLDVDRLADICRVRAIHQGLAARLCCEHAGRKHIRELREQCERIHALYCSGSGEDLNEALLLDRRMHTRLVEISASATLARACRSVWAPFVAADGEDWRLRHDETHREHLAIVAAIEENRPDDADKAAQEHVLHALDVMCNQIKSGKAELKWHV